MKLPVTLAIIAAREGGWDYRLKGVETSAIQFVSLRPYSTPDQARAAAVDRIADFNQTKFVHPIRMTLTK